ncbi:uncharacterized protein LOC135144896 [Zophobas morio]|uniref:uncharacterized protein LOC135144896 n=1 Tax=Zophobas morio TaxID=2755281 RepID=UPI003083101A
MGAGSSGTVSEKIDDLVTKTYFDRKELKLWYKGFYKECPSGRLTKDEFDKIYREFFPQGKVESFSQHIFNVFDTKKSGFIDYVDFVTFLSIASRGSIEEKLNWAFKILDVNNSGSVKKQEMLSVIESMQEMLSNFTDIVSTENSPQSRVDKIYELLDKKEDEAIRLEEFVSACSRDPSVCQSLSLYDGFI